jgi:NADH-quinone oxidoreductase subunit J
MNLINFIFLAFSAITLLCALMVVLTKSPIHSILYLILTMFSLSGHYILLHAQFIGVVNIIVYAGAIMVLFLFVLMLLNLNTSSEPMKSIKWKIIGIGIGIVLLVALTVFYNVQLTTQAVIGAELPSDFGYVKPLGQLLFTNYVFPFEISSILFIAAMVGVVFIGNREKKGTAND